MAEPNNKSKNLRKNLAKSTGRPRSNESRPNKKTCSPNLNTDDGIAKSKQLSQKIKNKVTLRSKKRPTNKNNELRICGNGKPMPSLSELEKMFEDSDTDEKTNVKPLVPTSENICITPKKKTFTEDKLLSPSTIKDYSNKVLEYLSKITGPSLVDEAPPPPVIPPKKRKKSDKPYIVGCKDRPQILRKLNTNFCKGGEEYGVEVNSDPSDDEKHPQKRAKRSKKANLSKSIFNAKSDEIAAKLKDLEGTLSDSSIDSNKTLSYDYLSSCNVFRSFSPLPSTSSDNATILKNEQLFNESIKESSFSGYVESKEEASTSSHINNMHNDVEIIDQPYETILVDDQIIINDTQPVIEINDSSSQPVLGNIKNQSLLNTSNDDFVEIVENETIRSKDNLSPISVEDYYSSIDINQTYDDVCEVIDVDEVIAENEAILKKYGNTVNTRPCKAVIGQYQKPKDVQLTKTTTNTDNNTPNESINKDCRILNDVNVTDIQPSGSNNLTINIDSPNLSQNIVNTNNSKALIEQCNNQIGQILTDFFHKEKKKPRCNKVCDSTIINGIGKVVSWMLDDTLEKRGRCCVYPSSTPGPTVTKNKSPERSKHLADCPICMDSLSRNSVASTLCGHIFCMKCIEAALKASGKRCPTCRKVLKGKAYHQIFL